MRASRQHWARSFSLEGSGSIRSDQTAPRPALIRAQLSRLSLSVLSLGGTTRDNAQQPSTTAAATDRTADDQSRPDKHSWKSLHFVAALTLLRHGKREQNQQRCSKGQPDSNLPSHPPHRSCIQARRVALSTSIPPPEPVRQAQATMQRGASLWSCHTQSHHRARDIAQQFREVLLLPGRLANRLHPLCAKTGPGRSPARPELRIINHRRCKCTGTAPSHCHQHSCTGQTPLPRSRPAVDHAGRDQHSAQSRADAPDQQSH